MTERELFLKFYSAARLDRRGASFADEERLILAIKADRAGLSELQVLYARNAAQLALINRKLQRREPSKSSVYIQCLVHTHGRVRRGA